MSSSRPIIVAWLCAFTIGCTSSQNRQDAVGAAVIEPLDGPPAGNPNPEATCDVPAEACPADVSHPTTVVGTGTPASCTSDAFVDAVARGGVIMFDCGPDPVTIALERTAKVFNDTGPEIVIDGGGAHHGEWRWQPPDPVHEHV